MHYCYPEPHEVGIKIPPFLRQGRFNAGFVHALKGGQLHRVEYFRLSFREGFRAAKFFLRYRCKRRGILTFPVRGKFRMRVIQ